MPAMEHGKVRLFETAAIARYADEAFDGPPLQPADPAGRARMTQWISAYNAYMAVVFGQRLVVERFAPRIFDRPTNEAVIRDNLPDLDRALDVLNGALADQPYLAGPAASLADLHVAPMLWYVGMTPEGQQRLPARPALARWLETVLARPSFAATVPKFGA
jgi:glutathione S-transferase